jgi:uncharacterized protein
LIAGLSDPQSYRPKPAMVEVVQTHISCVFLAGDDVYKVKKPVRFSFLDFSTLERRLHFCHEEVRLNRRLAASIYRGVVSIIIDGSRYRFAEESHPDAIEYAVHMRRLPQERSLDALIANGGVEVAMMDQLAQRLVRFHSTANCDETVTANGTPEAIWAILNDNFSNGRRFRGTTLATHENDLIESVTRRFLDSHHTLLQRRRAEGRIRDCHGDLHCDHICFADELLIYDCIEFNTQFRHIDVASEIAFLAMDLDYLDRHDLSRQFIERYIALADDPDALELLPFYACYRAYVRGKVDSLKSLETELGTAEREAAAESARRHFALSYRYAWSLTPFLIVVMGPSGSGKSTLAEHLGARLGFTHLNSDIIRKALGGVPATQRSTDARGESLYQPEYSRRTYGELHSRATAQLRHGRGVIVDATFLHRHERDAIASIAEASGHPIVFLECRCDEDTLRQRLAQRAARDDSPSDATWEIYQHQMSGYEPPNPNEGHRSVVIHTTAGMAPALAEAERALVAWATSETPAA